MAFAYQIYCLVYRIWKMAYSQLIKWIYEEHFVGILYRSSVKTHRKKMEDSAKEVV